MTNNNEMPDTVFVCEDRIAHDEPSNFGLTTEYIRADKSPIVGGDVKEALDIVDDYVRDNDPHEDRPVWEALKTLERAITHAPASAKVLSDEEQRKLLDGAIEFVKGEFNKIGTNIPPCGTSIRLAVAYAYESLTTAPSTSTDDGWRTIDSAPKDGKCLVAVNSDYGYWMGQLERDEKGNWIHEGEPTFCKSYYFEPTHWMPLPKPPTMQGGE